MLATRTQKRSYEDDEDDELASKIGPTGYIQKTQKQRLRRTPMARLLGVGLTDLELLNFFYHHSMVDILSANDPRDKVWIETAPSRLHNPTIKQSCLFLAGMDLAQRRAPSKYLVNDEPQPTYLPLENRLISGYVQPSDKFLTHSMRQFSKLLKTFHRQLNEMKEGDLDAYADMILAGTLVYIAALAMGPLVPLLNYTTGQGDLVSLSRSIRYIHEIMTGLNMSSEGESPFPILDVNERHFLAREQDLWDVIDMPESREEHSVLYKALHTLIELYNMDVNGGCITHMTSWPIYWTRSFHELQQQHNPYALVLICYWCAYVHTFHGFSWWRDRAVEDLYCVVDELPRDFHHLVSWPLSVVQTFDVCAEDYLSGKMMAMSF